jgi:CRISPR system Cascade subunit CasA
VSLREAFEGGQEIQDLAVRPHERIALMRLLICIVSAALDGPNDQDDWQACRPRIVPAVFDYLMRWRLTFELFGNDQPFLQVGNLKKPTIKSNNDDDDEDEGNSTSKLDLALATGNNATLFDNAGGSRRAFAPGEVALMLVTFQCFSPGGTIGVALWGGGPTYGWKSYPAVKPGQSDHAPCLAGGMLHALLRGESLLGTIHRNLISKHQAEQFFGEDSWGQPVWERMPAGLADAAAVRNANHTYLGRLVPLTRAIRLGYDCRSLILANGLEYQPYAESGWREPTATVVIRKISGQPKRMLLPASTETATWRELHALTVKAVGQNPGGPAALQHLSGEEAFDLWVGGLVAKKAKLVDTTESVFHVPAAMLTEPSQRVYESGVRLAETVEFRVRRAVSVYHKELGDSLDRPEMKKRRRQIQGKASAQFWTDVEEALPQLLQIAESPGQLGQPAEWYKTGWGRSVGRAARAAYDRACPHETTRQIRAHALGLKALFVAPAEQHRPEAEEETEA